MKIDTFVATNVHGYLDFNIKFNKDLNFLAGLNGTGKTTVLNLIISLFKPSLKKLIETDFDFIEMKFILDNGEENTIICEKGLSYLVLKYNNQSTRLEFKGLRYINDEDLKYELSNREIVDKIEQISTPMFLDLNRRFIKNSRIDVLDKNDKFMYGYNRKQEEVNNDLSLEEVKKLIKNTINVINRIEKRRLEKLKKDFISESFKIQISSVEDISTLPELNTIKNYKKTITEILDKLKLIDDHTIIENFFNTIEKNLEDITSLSLNKKVNNKEYTANVTKSMTSWIVNQPQLQKVINLSKLIDRHQLFIIKIHQNKKNFLDAVNNFFKETNKKITIKDDGDIEIEIKGKSRDINLLASGERQILIMLCHLYLNKDLPKNGVFIIDEPELSLHLLWQEKFVDEIIKAKSDLQIILATHSPAIIKNKQNKYVSLNG